jgi:CheY-like chemotaxis protein
MGTAPQRVTSKGPAGVQAGRLPRLDGRSIVVVEDDRDVREALGFLLESLGARVACAADGLQGLALAADARPDAIVCDLRMPGLDGLALLRRVRADRRLARLYVVLYSAAPESEDREWGRAAGFDAVVTKPAGATELVDVLERGTRLRAAA